MRLLSFFTVLIFSGCQSISDASQFAFAPKHYQAPVMLKSDNNQTAHLIIGNQDNYYLNSEHEMTQKFIYGKKFTDNSEFSEFAYAYIRVANHRCERREADMLKGNAAQQTGFNLVTTASAVAGSAFSSTNTANLASGTAAFFNSVSTNAGSFQSAINGQYSANLLQAIGKKREQDFGDITAKLDALPLARTTDHAAHAKISVSLAKYNHICTIGEAQKILNNEISG